MNGAQRLLEALNHRQSDKVPLDIGSNRMTGISMTAYRRLLKYRAMETIDPDPVEFDRTQRLALLPEAFLDALHVDTRGVFPAPPREYPLEPEGEGFAFDDEWGIRRRIARPDDLYYDICISPLAGADMPEDIYTYPWPDPANPVRVSGITERVREIDAAGCGVVMNGFTSGVLEMFLRLRGFEDGFANLAADPQTAGYLLDLITDMKIAYWEKALSAARGKAMVAIELDDLGTQNSLLMSPGMYREILMPRHVRLFRFIKRASPGIKVFLHSCGAVLPMIPLLIEAGVDILNPVQVSAKDMDTRELKRRFGAELVFWGGAVDSQHTLPHGTPDEVRDEVHRRIDDLAPGGGFIFSPIHNIQADVPPANLAAMLDAFENFSKY